MRLGSLFSGIGGFEVAAQQLGWEVKFFSEIEPWPCAVLRKHWPDVPNLGDITQIDFSHAPAIDVLCGGFPCQDISSAGKGAGIEGARSGLWSHYARAIEVLRPKWVLIENVSILRRRGLDRVLRDLDALGYDAEWHCVPASAVGAPHQRDRIWIVAYPRSVADTDRERLVHGQLGEQPAEAGVDALGHVAPGCQDVGYSGHASWRPDDAAGNLTDGNDPRGQEGAGGLGEPSEALGHPTDLGHERAGEARGRRLGPEDSGPTLGHPLGRSPQRLGEPADVPGTSGLSEGQGDQREWCGNASADSGEGVRSGPLGDSSCGGLHRDARGRDGTEPADGHVQVLPAPEGRLRVPQGDTHLPRLQGLGRLLERARERTPWADGEAVRGYDGSIRLIAPGVPLLAHGVPGRVGQLKSYGNAIVPHVALVFFQAIQEAETWSHPVAV